ncbi:MAG: hypothetical protein RLZZ63_181 [Gemmatimonadota bacterium]|jgi:PAS domain S-box-containing protein
MPVWHDQKEQAEERLRLRRQRRRILAFLLIAATTILASGAIVWRQFASSTIRETETLLRSLAQAKRDAIRLHLDGLEADARLIAERTETRITLDPALSSAQREGARRVMLDAIIRAARIHGYHDLYLFDATATIVAQVENTPIIPTVTAAIAEVIRTGETRVVGMHRGANGVLEYGVAVPVRRSTDTPPIGAVLIEAEINRWLASELVNISGSRETIESVLLERRGDRLHIAWAFSLAADDTTDRSFALTDSTRAGARAVTAPHYGEGIDYRGQRVLSAAFPISGSPWIVKVNIDRAEMMRPVYLFGGLILTICALVFGIVVAGWRAIWIRNNRELIHERESAARQALRVVETSNDCFLAVDFAGRIVAVNEAAETLWGRSHDRLIGRTLADLRGGGESERVREMLTHVREAGQFRTVAAWDGPDGTTLDLDVSARYSEVDDRIFIFLRDISALNTAQRRLERLNRLYVFLQHASEAIYRSERAESALAATCESAVSHGDFTFAFITQVDPTTGAVHPTTWAGPAAAILDQLVITLDPALPTSHGPTARALREGVPMVVHDVHGDPSMAPWRELAITHEIRSAAALPIMSAGTLVGALTLYTGEREDFEPELLAVLEDLVRVLGLVLESIDANAQAALEIARRQASEESLRRLFEASPLPMFVMDAQTTRTTRVNRAFTDSFGYTLADVPTCEAFLTKFRTEHTDQESPRDVMRRLMHGLDDRGNTLRSPDLAILSHDGGVRWVEAFLTQIADEIVVAWVDLTELRSNQARAREAQHIALLSSWDYDFVTGSTHRPTDFFEALGLPVADAQRHDPRLFGWLHPEDVAPTLDALVDALTAREACEITARVPLGAGRLGHVRIRATGQFEGERLVRAVGSAQNVTAEMRATAEVARYRDQLEERVAERTEALARANARLQMTDRRLQAILEMTQRASDLDEADIFQLGIDEATRLTNSGAGTLHLIAQEHPVVIGDTWSTGMSPLDGEDDPWREAIATRTPIVTEVGVHHERHSLSVPILEGERVRMLISVADKLEPYDDSDTQELQLIGQDVWNIVQQRRVDAALAEAFARVQQSDQRFAAAMEASSEGIWEWEIGARRITFSDVYHRLLGYEPGTLPTDQDGWITLVHHADRDSVTSQLAALLRSRDALEIEFRMRRRDGEERWMLARGKVVEQDERGAPRRVVGTLQDVTNRRGLEDSLRAAKTEAEEASRAKSAFLAIMSHEIRTPLNGVIGMAEIVSQSELPPREADAIRTIRASATTLLGLIDDILDFSKIEAGRLALEMTEVAIEPLLEDVIRTLEPNAARQHVELTTFVAPDVPRTVSSDPTRVRQILYNLIGNAVKFSGGHSQMLGRVMVRVERDPHTTDRLRLSVIDNGIGMSAETVGRLFTTFMQAESSTTRRFGGTGLGLAICKRLTDLMQGEITVESTLGAGTRFTVTLPMPAVSVGPITPRPDLRGVTCFVVSTRGEAQETADAATYLGFAGAEVREVTAAEDAVSQARSLAAPVVILAWPEQGRADATVVTDQDRIRTVHILRGRRRQPRVMGPGLITLDRVGVGRDTLVHAVAIAIGRASPIPLQQKHEVAPIQPAVIVPSVSDARANGTLILVAEDDEVNQKVILRQLELVGFAAELAVNGVEALRLWRSGHYALVITDLHMPEMDGYALAEAIRREEDPTNRIPILALTANALRGEEVRAKAVGIDEYLTKPIRLDQLRHVVRQHMPHAIEPLSSPHPVGATSWSDPSLSVLDLRIATSMVGSDPDTLREFLEEFRTHSRHLASGILAAHRANELAEIARLTHKLKSSARSMGAMALGELAAELETVARRVDADAVTHLIRRFEVAVTALEARLTAELGVAPTSPPPTTDA